MKVIIFNDSQNFNGSLNLINGRFANKDKRFWNYKKYIPFLLEKIKSLYNFDTEKIELVKTFIYEGRFSSTVISKVKFNCNQKISKLNQLINREHNLLNYISQEKLSSILRSKINSHVKGIKEELEEEKKIFIGYPLKQVRQFLGQKDFFESLKNNPQIEIKTTPLKQRNGEVYQKGVDVMLATDLVHLAHTGAYDIAIILSGDSDLVEAVKLVKSLGKTVIIVSYHTQGNPSLSNISDLMNAGKFLNLHDLSNDEIESMSELLE